MGISDNLFIAFFQNLLELSLEAAPWLVIGLALGGLMKALIPTEFLQRHLSGAGVGSIAKATVLGAPLPLCSCGVIPAALGLREAGASKPATAAFLVSTPETGVDSITVTYALMGPFMAIVRPISALVSAMMSGLLVGTFDPEDNRKIGTSSTESSCCDANTKPVESSCCETKPKPAETSCCATEAKVEESACCETTSEQITPVAESWMSKAWGGIYYAFTKLLDTIVLWLAVGMLFAAASKTFIPTDFLAQWGQGIPAMLVMIAAGIPMYICATASTPVAAGLLMAGVSPGVALVLLLTGPATNISTLGIISKELGKRSMWLYLSGVVVTAIIAGLVTDALVDAFQIDVLTQVHAGHGGLPTWLGWMSLALLVAVVFRKFVTNQIPLTQPSL
jgi:uncharacterized membrane protein YraQ (UPF0718 family)